MTISSGLFANDPQPSANGFQQPLVMLALAGSFFYFILWRPEQKRRKALEKQRNEMKKGDKVTMVGILGTIDEIQNDTVILKMYDGSKIEVLKAAITDVQSSQEETKKA